MPREIAKDIHKRIQTKDKKSAVYMSSNAGNNHSRAIQAMRDATDHTGILTIETLEKELAKMDIHETTSHHLIGQAEIEGILLRNGPETWSWLQQSS